MPFICFRCGETETFIQEQNVIITGVTLKEIDRHGNKLSTVEEEVHDVEELEILSTTCGTCNDEAQFYDTEEELIAELVAQQMDIPEGYQDLADALQERGD